MAQIGFIGFGSMGSMLVKGLIQYGQIEQNQIIITRKNKDKLKEIKDRWPEALIAQDATEVVMNSEMIFLCVKPYDNKLILDEIKSVIQPEQHIITITGSLMLQDIKKILTCKISKLMPTVISEVMEGVALICHNDKVTDANAKELEKLLESFTKIKRLPEKDFDFASEITSCGPGFFASIFSEFVNAGVRYTTSFTKEELAYLSLQTITGTIRLMEVNHMNFSDVIARVATKGGITEEGVIVLQEGLPEVFDHMYQRTLSKRAVVNEKMHDQFCVEP